MWHAKKLIIEANGYSDHHQYITHLPLCFQILGVPFFYENLPVPVSAFIFLNNTPQEI